MSNELASLPGYRLCQYKVAVQPPEAVSEKIVQVRKSFAEKFEVKNISNTRPQINLVTFEQVEMLEIRVINKLRSITMALKPFLVALENFESVPSHTINFKIESKGSLQTLLRQLKTGQQLMKTKETKPHFFAEPHLALANKLLPWQFEQGWLEMDNSHFTAKFEVNELLLFKRSAENVPYKLLQKFTFLSKPVMSTQGQLF